MIRKHFKRLTDDSFLSFLFIEENTDLFAQNQLYDYSEIIFPSLLGIIKI